VRRERELRTTEPWWQGEVTTGSQKGDHKRAPIGFDFGGGKKGKKKPEEKPGLHGGEKDGGGEKTRKWAPQHVCLSGTFEKKKKGKRGGNKILEWGC